VSRPALRTGRWRRLGAKKSRRSRELALRLLTGSPPLDPDEQVLVENGEYALEHGDRWDVRSTLQLRDERMRGVRTLGELTLCEVQLVATLADVGRDPVSFA
jgi:hypothetical protein